MADDTTTDRPDPADIDVDALDDDGWVRLETPRLLPPGLPQAVRGGADGTVTDDGTIELDQFDAGQLGVPESAALSPGTDVDVRLRDGHIYARSKAVSAAVKQYEDRRRRLAERARERANARERRQRKAEAEAFWAQYEIPVAFTVAIKGRRSGLSKGSWGDGRAADTVEHLFIQEPVDTGRLQRDAETYLCDDSAQFQFTEETRTGPDGEEYTPPVTCETCLERMERWRTTDGDGDAAQGERA